MTSSRSKRTLDDSKLSDDFEDDEATPAKKKTRTVTIAPGTKMSPSGSKPTPSRRWTTTNPDTGSTDGRLYRKDEVYKSHLDRRSKKKSKKKAVTSSASSPSRSGAAKPALLRKKTAAEKLQERAQSEMVDYSDLCQRFDSQHAIVAGGGEGVGQAVAIRLAQEGASVTIWDRKRFRDTVSICEKVSSSDEAVFDGFQVDVGDAAKVNAAMREYLDKHSGFVDVIVNAAGLSLQGSDKVMDVRLTASMNLVNSALPLMKEEKYGRIVLLCAKHPGDEWTQTANAAMLGYARTIAKKVATAGVTVNAVAFSHVDTPKADAAERRAAKKTPIKRMADAGEIAGVVAAAASEEMSFTTGSVFDATGGEGL